MPYKNIEDRRKRLKERMSNPDYASEYRSTQKKAREKKTAWFRSLKDGKPCHVCQKTYHPVCMDFHHMDRELKLFDLSRLSYSKKKVLEEVAKCVLLCAVCHRLVEHGVIMLDKLELLTENTRTTSAHSAQAD